MKLKGNLEPKVYADLVSHNLQVEYESEKLKYTTEQNRTYIPDFVVRLPDGRVLYLEVKGWLRPDDMVKLRRIKETYPDKDIRLVFEKDNKVTRSKLRYSGWAEKYDFPYCFGKVPPEWFE